MTAAVRPAALTWPGRFTRVSVLGGTSFVLAVVAHSAGGGHLPGVGVLAVAALVLGLVAVPLTTRRLRLPQLVAVLGVEQVLLHFVLAAAAAVAACAPHAANVAGHHQHTAIDSCAPVAGNPAAELIPSDWPMWAFHALALLATAWLLARGEAWLWRTADRIARAAFINSTGVTVRRPRQSPLPVLVLILTDSAYSPTSPRGPPTI